MNPLRFKVLVEWDPEDQVWVTFVPDLDWLSTYGDTREEALEQTREAILGYLEAAEKEGLPLRDTSNTLWRVGKCGSMGSR